MTTAENTAKILEVLEALKDAERNAGKTKQIDDAAQWTAGTPWNANIGRRAR